MKIRLLLSFLLLSAFASAQTYTESIVYNFTTTDGVSPGANGLVIDSAGNLYGTTIDGGSGTACQGGCGMVYELSAKNVFSILHSFTGETDGANPQASLTIDKSGNLYGTTEYGGLGYGTVFKITAAGKYSILYKFGKKPADGEYPYGPVTLDSAGNMYGTTYGGGSTSYLCTTEFGEPGCGIVFKLSPKGVETILYTFQWGTDGAFPMANLLRDSLGNIYGTNGDAVFFKVSPEGVESTLYTDCYSYFARNADGNFYGSLNSGYGAGIWEVTSNDVGSKYYFCQNCAEPTDGAELSGPVMFSGGNLYGTGQAGGAFTTETTWGGGVVYEFDPATDVETVLHSFPLPSSSGTGTDGWNPNGGVVGDSAGNLYGTTYYGGTYGGGTVFKLTKN